MDKEDVVTIPYSEGWTAEVDGKPAEITPVQDALMGIKLTKGSHDITLKYTPKAFKEGALISLVSVFLIVLISFVPALVRKLKKNKKTALAVAAEVPSEGENLQQAPIEEVPVEAILPEETKPEDVIAEETAEPVSEADKEPVPEEEVKPVAEEEKGDPETEDDQG